MQSAAPLHAGKHRHSFSSCVCVYVCVHLFNPYVLSYRVFVFIVVVVVVVLKAKVKLILKYKMCFVLYFILMEVTQRRTGDLWKRAQ